MTRKSKSEPWSPQPSKLCAIVNDIHFDIHDKPTWRGFCQWTEVFEPEIIVFDGDLVDLNMLSRYVQGPDAPLFAIPQIKCFVEEANARRPFCKRMIVREGNHDERWRNAFGGTMPAALKGAIGLTLEAQCRAHGLLDSVEWTREGPSDLGLFIGQYAINHGHRGASRFGGGKHPCATRIAKNMGQSEINAHLHRAQSFWQTSYGKTAHVVQSPCMTHPRDHDYAQNPDWQLGFVSAELTAPDYKIANAYPIVMDNGRFSYGGISFDGNAS